MEEEEGESFESESSQAYAVDEEFTKKVSFELVKKKEVKTQKAYDKENAHYLEKITHLTAEMEKISPNLKAIDRFKDVAERYKVKITNGI